MNFKKAIEPLIATILLIVIAVILVVIVLAWGKNFSTEGLHKANNLVSDDCIGATIALSSCDWDKDANTATFFIKNTSDTYTFPANGFIANVISDTNSSLFNMDKAVTSLEIAPGATVRGTITGLTTVTGQTRVTVTVRASACPNSAVYSLKNCQ